jgi:hypothetical protein
MSGNADGGRREFSRVCNQLTVVCCSSILLGIWEKFKMRFVDRSAAIANDSQLAMYRGW